MKNGSFLKGLVLFILTLHVVAFGWFIYYTLTNSSKATMGMDNPIVLAISVFVEFLALVTVAFMVASCSSDKELSYETPVKFGILASMIMIGILMVYYLINVTLIASKAMGFIIYMPLIFLMVFGGITYRNGDKGVISFKRALTVIMIISITATTVFEVYSTAFFRYVDKEAAEKVKHAMIEKARPGLEQGLGEDKADEMLKKMEEQDATPDLKMLISRLESSVLVGIIFSLMMAAFVRRNPNIPTMPSNPTPDTTT
jgi:hypothetical protein